MMGGILVAILALLIQVGIFAGIVVLVVKAAGGRKSTSEGENPGVRVRRLFVYTLMLLTLVLVGLGIAGLIDAAIPNSAVVIDNTAAVARSIAFVLVGLPVYLGLWRYTLRRFAADAREQLSFGWAFYLVVALVGSLVATMALVSAVLVDLVNDASLDRGIWINAFVWAAVWLGHWLVAERYPSESGSDIHLILGSIAGLGWTFVGLITTFAAVLSIIYERVFLTSIGAAGLSDLLEPAAVVAVGVPVWLWYWIRHARTLHRSLLWLVYALLLGVMGGLITAISGAGAVVFSVFDWFLGDVSVSAATHFDVLPVPIAALLVGVGVWLYHAHVVGVRDETSRGEVDRVYGYLLAAAGLLVAAAGITTIIASTLIRLSTKGVTAVDTGEAVAAALTLLIIGVPLWWRYWSSIQKFRRTDLVDELTSVTRRIYIVALFGVAAVVSVISLIVIVFIVVEDLLDGTMGVDTISSSAVAISLVLTSGAISWYHFKVFQEDRNDSELLPPPPPPPPPAVKAPTSTERGILVPRGTLEKTLDDLAGSGGAGHIVTVSEDGYMIEPISE